MRMVSNIWKALMCQTVSSVEEAAKVFIRARSLELKLRMFWRTVPETLGERFVGARWMEGTLMKTKLRAEEAYSCDTP